MKIWLSFSGLHRPLGHKFIGVVIVDVGNVSKFLTVQEMIEHSLDIVATSGLMPCECAHVQPTILPIDVPDYLVGRMLTESELIAFDLGERMQ